MNLDVTVVVTTAEHEAAEDEPIGGNDAADEDATDEEPADEEAFGVIKVEIFPLALTSYYHYTLSFGWGPARGHLCKKASQSDWQRKQTVDMPQHLYYHIHMQ